MATEIQLQPNERHFMALIKCSECGNDVSSQATACPHCGCPVAVTLQQANRLLEAQTVPKPPKQRDEKWDTRGAQHPSAPPAPEDEARRGRELLRGIGIFLYIVGFTILSAAFSDQNRGWAFFGGSLTVIFAWGLRMIAADLATKRKRIPLGGQVLLCSMSALLLAGIVMMSGVFKRRAVEQQTGGLPKVLTQYTCTHEEYPAEVRQGLDVILNGSPTDVYAPSYRLGDRVRVKIIAYTKDEKYAYVKVLEGQYAGKQGYIATAIMKPRPAPGDQQDRAGTPLMEAVENHDLNAASSRIEELLRDAENTGGKAKPTKAEWLHTLESRYGQNAHARIVDAWNPDDFKKFMGNPSSTQTVGDQVSWHYECSDGQIEIELNTSILYQQGKMWGRINDY